MESAEARKIIEENFYGGKDLIPVLIWKAQQLDEAALDASGNAASEMREHAQFFREAVSQLQGERIPAQHTDAQRVLLTNAMKEFLDEQKTTRTIRKG